MPGDKRQHLSKHTFILNMIKNKFLIQYSLTNNIMHNRSYASHVIRQRLNSKGHYPYFSSLPFSSLTLLLYDCLLSVRLTVSFFLLLFLTRSTLSHFYPHSDSHSLSLTITLSQSRSGPSFPWLPSTLPTPLSSLLSNRHKAHSCNCSSCETAAFIAAEARCRRGRCCVMLVIRYY